MNKLDLPEIHRKWLHLCGSCDAGLPMDCTCTGDDPRAEILRLVNHLEDLYNNYDLLLCSTMGEAMERLESGQRIASAAKDLVEYVRHTIHQDWQHPLTRELIKAVDRHVAQDTPNQLDPNMS